MAARPASASRAGEPKQAGVGIYFQDSPNGEVVVNHIISGGSADRSGIIKLGDIVVSIDSQDIRGKPLEELRKFFIGPEGSTVTLGFERGENRESFIAQLTFGSPEFIANLDKGGKKSTRMGASGLAAGTATSTPTTDTPTPGGTGTPSGRPARDDEVRRLEEALKAEITKRRMEEKLRLDAEEAVRRLSAPGQSDQIVRLQETLRQERERRVDEERRREDAERRLALATSKGPGMPGAAVPGGGAPAGASNHDLRLAQEKLAAAEGRIRQMEQQLQSGAARAKAAAADAESRDTGRLAMIAIPHLVSHLQALVDQPDRPRALAAVSTSMIQLLDSTCSRCIASIPQAAPQLVSLLASHEMTTAREASFAIALTSMTPNGRNAILNVQVGVPHLVALLSSTDVETRRHSALGLGNIAMDPAGRRAMLDVFSLFTDLTRVITDPDLDCRRSAALALGNVLTEAESRERLLQIVAAVRALAEQLKSPDRLLVRYAAGALRNLAVDDRGRRTLLANQEAVAALKGLLSSPDVTTARFAEAALKNLSMAPATAGEADFSGAVGAGGLQDQGNGPALLGFSLPFFDGDGMGIPKFVSAK